MLCRIEKVFMNINYVGLQTYFLILRVLISIKRASKSSNFILLLFLKIFMKLSIFAFICSLKALSHGAIFHATCNAILHLRNVN